MQRRVITLQTQFSEAPSLVAVLPEVSEALRFSVRWQDGFSPLQRASSFRWFDAAQRCHEALLPEIIEPNDATRIAWSSGQYRRSLVCKNRRFDCMIVRRPGAPQGLQRLSFSSDLKHDVCTTAPQNRGLNHLIMDSTLPSSEYLSDRQNPSSHSLMLTCRQWWQLACAR